MEISEIKKKSQSELKKILAEKREKLRQLRFDLSSGKVKNVREIRMVKKDIARILTIMNLKLKAESHKPKLNKKI